MLRRGTYTALFAAFASTFSHGAIVMVDDFIGGNWTQQMGGTETRVSNTATNLDPWHAIFGMRSLTVEVSENFFQMPLNIRSGDSMFSVQRTGLQTFWTMNARYDAPANQFVNMSNGDQIWVDGSSNWTSGNNLRWGVIDRFGGQGYTGGFIKGNGYYYVPKSWFGSVDWTQVKTFIFELQTNSIETHIDNIMLAPEPGSLFVTAALVTGLLASRRRRSR